jgi:hypothetical protein
VEKNPSRKSLKAEKSRKSYLRASSNRQQRSFGSAGVLKPNQKLSYKYASKAISRSKGNSKMRPPLAKYRKSSRKAQKHTGNIFLQPAAKKRDYNEIRLRVERNPGRSMAKQLNQQKNRAVSNSGLMQSYRGGINAKSIRSKQKARRRNAKVRQKSSGRLMAGSAKSTKNQRKYNSSPNANYRGSTVIPSANSKSLRSKYMSKVIQKHQGYLKRGSKAPGPQYSSNFKGNVRSKERRGFWQWKKYEGKRQTAYSGHLKARRSLRKPGANTQITQHVGGIKMHSAKQRDKSNSFNSKMISKYTGDLRKSSKRSRTNEGRFQGGYEGSKEVLSRRKQNNFYSRRSKKSWKLSGSDKATYTKTTTAGNRRKIAEFNYL